MVDEGIYWTRSLFTDNNYVVTFVKENMVVTDMWYSKTPDLKDYKDTNFGGDGQTKVGGLGLTQW